MRTPTGTVMMVPFPEPGKWRLLETAETFYGGDDAMVARRFSAEISTGTGSRYDVQAERIPLDDVPGWTQPLIEPCSRGIAAFLARSFDGVLHVLANAKVEGGFLDTVELAPTVQCSPDNFEGLKVRLPFLDLVMSAPADRIRYDAIHSEEGGRFLYAENRYLVIEADEQDAPIEPPTGYQWVTISQLTALIKHGHYVNVQARTLLACLNAMGHLTDD
jgi:oxidase EvaA